MSGDVEASRAALVCAGGDAIPTTCASAMRWTFGGSRTCKPTAWFACERR